MSDVSQLNTAARGHHPDSPSSLQSSAACPHFVNLQRDTAASAAGVLQHKAAEIRDFSILEEPEQVDAVKRALAVEDEWISRLMGFGLEVEIIREEYLAVCPAETVVDEHGQKWNGVTGGYPDTLLLGRHKESKEVLLVVILDWKFGKILVTPTKDNLQGKSYALAALQRWATAGEVLVQFYHPYAEAAAPLPEYTHTFTRADMPQMELEIRHVRAQKHRAKAEGWGSDIKPRPCSNLCIWCARLDRAECPAVAGLALVASAKYEPLSVPAEIRPAYLTEPEHMKAAYRVSGVIEKLAKALRRRITDAVLTEGVEIEGMRIVTKSDREVVSVDAVLEAAQEFGVTADEFKECVSIPITKVEALVKAKAPKGKGAPLVRAFQQALEERGATKKGKPYSYLAEVKEDDAIDL
jgi:hypothetical protein